MQLSILPISLLLSLTAAQTTSTGSTSSVCAAQPVLEACLASTQAIAEGCASTDYNCLCEKYGDVLTCFNQCPNDSRQPSVLSEKQTYCADATVYTSSGSSAVSAPVSSAAGASATAATTTGSSGAETTNASGGVVVASSTQASSAATGTSSSKSGAETLMAGAGSVVMGFAGLVGAFL